MNPEIKAKWVKALRSKRYKQAEGTLRDDEGAMCCLGVLGTVQRIDWDGVDDFVTETLPEGFNAGLTKRQRNRLAKMNDGTGSGGRRYSFKEIADYIEAKL